MTEELNKERKNDKQRTSKKEIKYIENDAARRTTYHKRSHSLILAVNIYFVATSKIL